MAGISLATTLPAEDVSHPDDHDSRTLMFLAGISAACKRGKRLRIIVDLLDPRNINLATNISADDVIIGAEMVSRFMAQIVSNKKRYRVYEELLSYHGSEIYIMPLDY